MSLSRIGRTAQVYAWVRRDGGPHGRAVFQTRSPREPPVTRLATTSLTPVGNCADSRGLAECRVCQGGARSHHHREPYRWPGADRLVRHRDDDVLPTWRRGIAAVAACPNVIMKLGGVGQPRFGFDWHARTIPIGLEELAAMFHDTAARVSRIDHELVGSGDGTPV